jgi:serine/threonine-protein kinase RsbW
MTDAMPEPKSTPETIVLRLPSRLELLGLLDGLADSLCERLAFDEDARSQITMSVIEAGTNAIQHGHRRDASKSVDIEFRVLPDALEIVVHDSGKGFDLKSVNGNMTSPEHLLDARGRGIYIMRACMDQVDWAFTGTGTTCRLLKKRPLTPTPDP